MKKPASLIWLLLLFSCHHQRPAASPATPGKPHYDAESFHRFHTLELHEILNRLYDSPVIQGRTAIWKPNYSETMSSFRVSYDDSCHTTIDTILYFKGHDSANCAVIVFATYHYYVDSLEGMKTRKGDCHSCGATVGMALFSQDTDSSWQNYAFTKSLTISGVSGGTTAGGIGQFSLVQLQDRYTGLLLKEPVYAQMGEEKAYAELFSIEERDMNGYYTDSQLQDILSYAWHSSCHESGVCDREENTALEVVKRKGRNLLRLVTTTNKKPKIKDYRYSDEEGKYIPVSAR